MPWAVNFDNPGLRIEEIQSQSRWKGRQIRMKFEIHALFTSVADSRSRFLMFCVDVSMFGSKWVLWLLFVSTKIIIQVNADSCLKMVVILRWNYPRSTLVFDINSESFSESINDSFKIWLVALTRKQTQTNSKWDHKHYQSCRQFSVVRDRTLLICSYVFVLNQVTRCLLSLSMARPSG